MGRGSEWYQIGPNWAWETPLTIKDTFSIIQNFQTSPISQTSFLIGTFFGASYSKIALVVRFSNFSHKTPCMVTRFCDSTQIE